jgi:hypothetical protein
MILERVISGGQSGADQAGLRAAKKAGIQTGGWMPPRFATEDGDRPEFFGLYGVDAIDCRPYLREGYRIDWAAAYRDRTRMNVEMADATIWFGNHSPGYWATLKPSNELFKPIWDVGHPPDQSPRRIAAIIRHGRVRILNIAGNRESSTPGIGRLAEDYLDELFRILLDSNPANS